MFCVFDIMYFFVLFDVYQRTIEDVINDGIIWGCYHLVVHLFRVWFISSLSGYVILTFGLEHEKLHELMQFVFGVG